MLLKYQDDDGNIRMSVVKDSKWRRYQSGEESDNVSMMSEEVSDDSHAHLYEYARREGPNDEAESIYDKFNISEEDFVKNEDFMKEIEESHEQEMPEHYKHVENFQRHPYADDYSESALNSHHVEESEEQTHKVQHVERHPTPYVESYPSEYVERHPTPYVERHREATVERHQKPCRKCSKNSNKSKKIVYVYKQPPIIVKPKPTNVYIKSKPIVVQPPPLVVHHPEPKPCNPIIKYQPPNIKLKPVIVKISKPKRPITTPTTPCPTTTKKPCRKCRRKPTKNCHRCSRRKHTKPRSENYSVYYNHHNYRSADPPQYVQYKNVKCSENDFT
ncbi:CLUMA_CG010918, isoform A [Clunio marinus]|uniref:CLUMA_CG010918, isoform A n=1 Tax=Clunio marinus TaxID=568069 RepID=A0A1J1ICQ0_9DIPT|nr:CLUMA_CG010918, isoform A [Clunio marinus]